MTGVWCGDYGDHWEPRYERRTAWCKNEENEQLGSQVSTLLHMQRHMKSSEDFNKRVC